MEEQSQPWLMGTALPKPMDVTDSAADKSSVGHLLDFLDISKVFHASTSFLQQLPQIRVNTSTQTRRPRSNEHMGE